MNEIRLEIQLFEYQLNVGGFKIELAVTKYDDIDKSVKQLFQELINEFQYDANNKFFIMKIQGTIEDEYAHNMYTIRTNNDGKVEDIQIISPNSVDRNLLIDAILGRKITDYFVESCSDSVIKKCISKKDDKFVWCEDARQRLEKVNGIRLKEYYKKLKS